MVRRRILARCSLVLFAALLAWQTPDALARGSGRVAQRPARVDVRIPMQRTPSGVLVPARKKLLVPRRTRLISVKDFRTGQRAAGQWTGARRSALAFLAGEGTTLAPARYQRLLRKLLRNAEDVINQAGESVADFEPMVIDGPPGSTGHGINAGAWKGGLFTLNKDTVDFAFLIADAYVSARSEAELHTNLAQVADWQRRSESGQRVAAPEFRVASRAYRDDIAEGILGFVVNHEVGHAVLDHVGVSDPDALWLPPTAIETPPFNAVSRQKESDADDFAVAVGAAGAIKYKEAMVLLPFYWHLQRPRWDPNAPLAQGREDASHPVSKDRFNNVRGKLEAMGFNLGALRIPPALDKDTLWVPESFRRAAR